MQKLLYVSYDMWMLTKFNNNTLGRFWTSILAGLLCLVFWYLSYGFLKPDMWIMAHWSFQVLRKLGVSAERWFIIFSHLSCLSFKISHHFIGIITLIFNLEGEKCFTPTGLTRNHSLHQFSLSVPREGRVSATSPVESWSVAGLFCRPST